MTRLITLFAVAFFVALATATPLVAYIAFLLIALLAMGGAVAGAIVIGALVSTGALWLENRRIPIYVAGSIVALAVAGGITTQLWVSSCPSCAEGDMTRADAYRGATLFVAIAAGAAVDLIGLGALVATAVHRLHGSR
jgi:hypothetical protein